MRHSLNRYNSRALAASVGVFVVMMVMAASNQVLGQSSNPDRVEQSTEQVRKAIAAGDFKTAEKLLRERIQPDRGLGNADLAEALESLAWLYQYQGRYSEAESLLQRALALEEKVLGSEPSTARTLNGLGVLYYYQGRYSEAEPLLQRALAIQEKALGSEHPDTASILNNLALLYQYQARYSEAEPFFKRTLAIQEKALGGGHPDTARTLNNLGLLYQKQGRYAEAEVLLKRSLAIREKAFGSNHPETAANINSLAVLYQEQGRYAEAARFSPACACNPGEGPRQQTSGYRTHSK